MAQSVFVCLLPNGEIIYIIRICRWRRNNTGLLNNTSNEKSPMSKNRNTLIKKNTWVVFFSRIFLIIINQYWYFCQTKFNWWLTKSPPNWELKITTPIIIPQEINPNPKKTPGKHRILPGLPKNCYNSNLSAYACLIL